MSLSSPPVSSLPSTWCQVGQPVCQFLPFFFGRGTHLILQSYSFVCRVEPLSRGLFVHSVLIPWSLLVSCGALVYRLTYCHSERLPTCVRVCGILHNSTRRLLHFSTNGHHEFNFLYSTICKLLRPRLCRAVVASNAMAKADFTTCVQS